MGNLSRGSQTQLLRKLSMPPVQLWGTVVSGQWLDLKTQMDVTCLLDFEMAGGRGKGKA